MGLDLKAPAGACSAEMPLESVTSAFEFWGTFAGLAPGAHSAIVLELKLIVLSLGAARGFIQVLCGAGLNNKRQHRVNV